MASLDRLVGEPLRYGYLTELTIVDGGESEVERVVADDRTDVVFAAQVSDLAVDGHIYPALGLDERKGTVEWEMLSGRPPATPDEIVLGTRVADELGKGTGDVVTVDTGEGEQSLAVVGVGVLPRFDTPQIGRNVAVEYEALDDLSSVDSFGEVGLSPAPGTSADELAAELAADYELTTVELPADVQHLDDLDRIPDALGLFLGLLAVVALAHSILVAARRRRRDVAMLRVLGFTPGQTAVSFGTSAAAIGVAGAVLGLPLGIALGATVWRWVAENAGVAGDALVPSLALGTVVVGSILVALVVVALPALRAGRDRPATALRAE
jgi:ABC-type antimicrobial peptide transport system permease subunit